MNEIVWGFTPERLTASVSCQSQSYISSTREASCFILSVMAKFGIIFLTLAVFINLASSKLYSNLVYIKENLCSYPMCDCEEDDQNGGWSLFCSCKKHHAKIINNTFVLYFPVIVPMITSFVHISDCDMVEIVNSGLPTKDEYFVPNWLIIHRMNTLKINRDVRIFGRNIVISDVQNIPEFPTSSLYLAPAPLVADMFLLKNIKNVGVVRSAAFDRVLLSKKFVLENVVFNKLEENAFNITLKSPGNFMIKNCTIVRATKASFWAMAQAVQVAGNHFGHVESGALEFIAKSVNFTGNNFFDHVERTAFNVRATSTTFVENYFHELEEEAFSKITVSFENNSSMLNFTGNKLNILSNGSIHMEKEINGHDALQFNSFMNCTKTNVGWIWETAFGPSFVPNKTRQFYQKFLSQNNTNVCFNQIEAQTYQTCSLADVTQMYYLNANINNSLSNSEVCSFLVSSSMLQRPNVINFVLIFFYFYTV